jgi:hypothetical protein
MLIRSNVNRGALLTFLVSVMALAATCDISGSVFPPTGDKLAVGTWGGENAGVIVGDTLVHVHVGCTLGDFPAPVALDQDGRFNVSGSYTLRAYPVQIGPPLPAQFAGRVENGQLTLAIAVNDTVEKKLVQVGPVTVTFGREPRMGPCPICRTPGDR